MLNNLLQMFSVGEINTAIALLAIGIIIVIFNNPFALAYALITGLILHVKNL